MVSGALRRKRQLEYDVLRVKSLDDVCRIEGLVDSTWPAYAVYGHPPETAEYLVDWPKLYELWPEFQFGILERETGALIATGNALPLAWYGDAKELPEHGWDWAMHMGRVQQKKGEQPNCLIPIAITVNKDWRGLGVSRYCLDTMKWMARENQLSRIFAPVRPSRKSDFPEVSIDDYIQWRTIDGRVFDPWLRTHVGFGGKVIKPCHQSMTFHATVEDWRHWTGAERLHDGRQCVPDLLSELVVDVQNDVGVYVEPNVWVEHDTFKNP